MCLTWYASSAQAQEPLVQPLTAPPPLKLVPKDEQAQIDALSKPKDRVKLILGLAESHLDLAEQHTSKGEFEIASGEIGKYHALIDDGLKFVASQKRDSNKTRDLYKRIELLLRAHGARLTSMRRSTPQEYSIWIKEVEEFARKGRTEALNSFYGHTVFREPQEKAAENPVDSKSKALAPGKKKP